MKKAFYIFIILLLSLNCDYIYAQSKKGKKDWANMSVKEKRNAINDLGNSIRTIQSEINGLRADSAKTHNQFIQLDSLMSSSRAEREDVIRLANSNNRKKENLDGQIGSLNHELSEINKMVRYITAYVDDKLCYPWNSSVNGAISAIDSIRDPKLHKEYEGKKELLVQYKQLYDQVILVIKNAQEDRARIDSTQIEDYKSRMLSQISTTDYVRNYSGKIPFLETIIKHFRSEVNKHTPKYIADFRTLLRYDEIERL